MQLLSPSAPHCCFATALSCVPFRPTLQEWLKDHRLFVATLEELAGQLAILQPSQQGQLSSSSSQPPRPGGGATGSGSGKDERQALFERLMQRAPSEQLRACIQGRMPAARLQRTLPEQLDANMRLLSILSAEMRALVQRLEQLADAAAAAAVQRGGAASGIVDGAAADSAAVEGGVTPESAKHDPGNITKAAGAADAEEALLLAAVADGAAKETLLIVSPALTGGGILVCNAGLILLWAAQVHSHRHVPQLPNHVQTNAAAGMTLTTPPDEVSAAATILQLEPFLSSTLLAAVRDALTQGEALRMLVVKLGQRLGMSPVTWRSAPLIAR